MIAIKLCWLVLELLFIWCFAYFGSVEALALAALLILVPICTIPVSFYLRKKIIIKIEGAASIRKHESSFVTVKIENTTILPILRLRCEVRSQNQLNRQMQKLRLSRHRQLPRTLLLKCWPSRSRLGRSRILSARSWKKPLWETRSKKGRSRKRRSQERASRKKQP